MQDVVHQYPCGCSDQGHDAHTHKVKGPEKGLLCVVDELAYILCQMSEK